MNYLTADTFAARPNVDLLLNTRVTKLTFNVTSPLAVNGVTIQQSRTGALTLATCELLGTS